MDNVSESPSSDSKPILKREDLVGKQVVSSEAKIVGTVSEVAFSANGRVILQLQAKDGTTAEMISGDSIFAIGDLILLKPPVAVSHAAELPQVGARQQVPPPPFPGSIPTKICARCGHANNQSAKFCIKCGLILSQ